MEGVLLATLGSAAALGEGLLGLQDVSCLSSALAGIAVADWELQEQEYDVTGAHAARCYGLV